jgi:hypothetical protein
MMAQQSSKAVKIKQLMELTGTGKMAVQVVDQIISTTAVRNPKVDPKFWEEFSKSINPEDMINLIMPVYEKFYSEEDIDNMIIFYNTPTGKKMIQVLPYLTQESMRVGQQWGMKIAEDIMKKLKDKGYK